MWLLSSTNIQTKEYQLRWINKNNNKVTYKMQRTKRKQKKRK